MAKLTVCKAIVTGNTFQSVFKISCDALNLNSALQSISLYSDEYLIRATVFIVGFYVSFNKVIVGGSWVIKSDKLIFIKFMKPKTSDDDYAIKLSSKKLQIFDKMFSADDDGDYHLIGMLLGETLQECKLDITVRLEIKFQISHFAQLFDDDQLTDFELRGDDGTIRVHKLVLAAVSPVLKQMLCGKWKEVAEGFILLQGVSIKTLQNLKNYMYCDILPEEGLQQLLLLASQYLMKVLEHKCASLLLRTLTADNTLELLDLAVRNNLTYLTIDILERVQTKEVAVNDLINIHMPERDNVKLSLINRNKETLKPLDADALT